MRRETARLHCASIHPSAQEARHLPRCRPSELRHRGLDAVAPFQIESAVLSAARHLAPRQRAVPGRLAAELLVQDGELVGREQDDDDVRGRGPSAHDSELIGSRADLSAVPSSEVRRARAPRAIPRPRPGRGGRGRGR
ncbi:hypothetical protein Anae109_4002 [Anaeromyxobacter sp. Fw109-5]|nr:hypothetical protein Anae109_4002 [Anaeromyxobacter sp. Fw109-5]